MKQGLNLLMGILMQRCLKKKKKAEKINEKMNLGIFSLFSLYEVFGKALMLYTKSFSFQLVH